MPVPHKFYNEQDLCECLIQNFNIFMVLSRIHTNRLINCCSDVSTIIFSNQSSVSFIYNLGRYQRSADSLTDGGRTMAKMKTTPRARMPTSVTAATKWPDKTKKFLASIDAALNIFNDQVSSIDNHRETAYKTFSKAYREAFADIWPKITNASVKILLQSIKDAELHESCCMAHLMSSEKSKPTLVKETRTVPTLDNILGSLVNRISEQKLPDKETCALISTIFADLAKAHKHYANAARGIADIAGLISLKQLTLVLAAAVPPTLQLVLPPGQISPLSAPPPPPTTATTVAGRQAMIKYCKNMILPDPAADAFKECDERTPTRILAAAVFCTLEKHLFDETMPRAEVASLFCITAAQLHKAVTGEIIRVDRTHTKGKGKLLIQTALRQQNSKRQMPVHFQHLQHRVRHQAKKHQPRGQPKRQKQITL